MAFGPVGRRLQERLLRGIFWNRRPLRHSMALLNGQDLIDAGWRPSPQFRDILEAVTEAESRGVRDRGYLLKLLERDFPREAPVKPGLRDQAAPCGEAIVAVGQEEEVNLAGVRRAMGQLLRTPVIEAGAILPDACPAGPGEAVIPVGGAIAARHAILPGAHSADICCSLWATVFFSRQSAGEMLDDLLVSTRFGAGGRAPKDRVRHPVTDEDVWQNKFLHGLQEHAEMHLADQGDGNHFAYLGKLDLGKTFLTALEQAGHEETVRPLLEASRTRKEAFVLVTHHGSRGLGAHVYKRGHQAAIEETERIASGIPKAAAWLDTRTGPGQEYWTALQYVSRWTRANHQTIHQRFLERTGAGRITEFGNEHNFVWQRGDLFLHGKGATPAWKDESGRPLLGLIPLNMAEPVLITLGSDNADHLSFCPHGAGRNRSRSATRRDFRGDDGRPDEALMEREIRKATRGLDIRWYHGKADVTESPIGYKPAAQVRAQIAQFGLGKIIGEITPLGCIMAGDPGPRPWLRERELTPKQKRAIEHRAERRQTRRSLTHWEDADDEEFGAPP